MANEFKNQVLIRGPAGEIKRYKDSLLKDATGKYYSWFSTVPVPELKDEAEVQAYLEREYHKTVYGFHFQATSYLEVIENSPGELELNFFTAYNWAQNLGRDDLFTKLSILHKFCEPMNNVHGFAHYVKGKMIASGYEEGEEQLSPRQMYDYNPCPAGANSLEENELPNLQSI